MCRIKNKIIIFFSTLFILSNSFAAGVEDYQAMFAQKVDIPIQERYEALSEFVPAYVMLQAGTTSVIPGYIAVEYQDTIYRCMIDTEKMKPVSLDKWLMGKYTMGKANNSKEFIYALADERYPCLIAGVCQPFILKSSDGYVIILSFYRFTDNGYPITVIRTISSLEEMKPAVAAMLEEYSYIIENKTFETGNKKKIIVKPFVLESRTFIGQSNGEFDYIPSTFIEQDGVTIKPEDDMFSRLFAYLLYTTEMVQSVATIDLAQFVNTEYNTYDYADYIIEGRIQLTDQINIFHISLRDARTNKLIKNVKFFNPDFSMAGLWDSYHNIIYSLADDLFGKDAYGVAPDISTPGQGLFINNIFLGWDRLEKCVLPKGKHFIYTGDYLRPDASVELKGKTKTVDINGNIYRSFFLYLDDRNWIFRGKDGERVWKLLEK